MTKEELTEQIKRLEHDLDRAERTHDTYVKELTNHLAKVAHVKDLINRHDKGMVKISRKLIEAYNQLQAMEGKEVKESGRK